jgi:hypothetical protein
MWVIEKIKTFIFNIFLKWIWVIIFGTSGLMTWLLGAFGPIVKYIGWIGLAEVGFCLFLFLVAIYFVTLAEWAKKDFIERHEIDTDIYMTSLGCLTHNILWLKKDEFVELPDDAEEILSEKALIKLSYNIDLPDAFIKRLRKFLGLIELNKNERRNTIGTRWELKLSSTGESIGEIELNSLAQYLKKDVQTLKKHFKEKVKEALKSI